MKKIYTDEQVANIISDMMDLNRDMFNCGECDSCDVDIKDDFSIVCNSCGDVYNGIKRIIERNQDKNQACATIPFEEMERKRFELLERCFHLLNGNFKKEDGKKFALVMSIVEVKE